MTDTVVTQIADGVATITLNRPAMLNALDESMARELNRTALAVEHDGAVRCVVIRGAGEHFMAGGDITYFRRALELDSGRRREVIGEIIAEVHGAVAALQRMPKPVIASARGAVAGFGVSLVAGCDLALAAEDSMFTLAYRHIGASPDGGGTWHLPRVLGMKRAMELALLGERFDARRAEAIGLVNRVVATAELEGETALLARRLAEGPTLALASAKRLLNASWGADLEEQLDAEAEGFARCALSDDFAEGVTAFCEKRPARFSGK